MKARKHIAILLSLLICALSVLPLTAQAYVQEPDVEWEINRYNSSTGAKVNDSSTNYLRTKDYIDVSKAETVSLTMPSGYKYNVHYYDENKTFLSSKYYSSEYSSKSGEKISVSDYSYVTFSVSKNSGVASVSDASSFKIEIEKEIKSYQAEIHPTGWVMGSVNYTTGQFTNVSSGATRSDYVDVSEYNYIAITNRANCSYNFYWYDENKKYISSERINSSFFTELNVNKPVLGKYVVFAVWKTDNTDPTIASDFTFVGKHIVNDKLIDNSKSGTITIYDYQIPEDLELSVYPSGEETDYSEYFKAIGATPLAGVTFKATKVVDNSFRNGNGQYFYTYNNQISLPTVADVKNSLAANDGVYSNIETYIFNATDASGMTTRSSMPKGIYLIQEIDEPNSVVKKTADFLVSVPSTSADNSSWNYNIVVYPKAVNGVVLTYDANNGSGMQKSEPRLADKTEPLTENTFTTTGKIFLGWADEPTSNAPKYRDMQDFTMPDHDTTIYAIWGYSNTFRYYTAFKYSEPWGLKLSFAMLNPNTKKVIDYTKYDDYGMYILPMHDSKTKEPDRAEIITKGKKASAFEPVSLTFNDGSTDNYLTTIFDEEIYTQNLGDDIYTLCYVTYKGRTFWGTVKNRCVEDSIESIINNQQVGLTPYTEAEVKLATAIKGMYDAEMVYYNKAKSTSVSYPDGKRFVENKDIKFDWESGYYNTDTGKPVNGTAFIRIKEVDVSKYDNISFSFNSTGKYAVRVFKYDDNHNFLGSAWYASKTSDSTWNVPNDTKYLTAHIYCNDGNDYKWTDEDYKRFSAVGTTYNTEKTFKPDWEQGGLTTPTSYYPGTPYESDKAIRSAAFIDVSKYTSMDVKYNGNESLFINMYDINYNFLNRQALTSKNTTLNSFPSGAKYIKTYIYKDSGIEPSDADNIEITLKRFSNGENKTFTHLTALRAIEPWEMKLQAQPQNAEYDSYDDYGIITYTDYYNSFDKDKTLTYEDMINNENCVIFSHKDNTCSLETVNGSKFITATSENIYTYRLQQTNVYTCFYYIKDGQCYYSDVKKRNSLDMAKLVVENGKNGDELSVAAANVATQMINLYRETYYYKNGKYPTDDYDGPVYYSKDNT